MQPRSKEGAIALNAQRVGHRYPPYHYEVGREKIREYAAATGVDGETVDGDGRLVAPPTFAACFTVIQGATAALSDPELGAHDNLVHGSQEFTWHRPVRAGDVLACTPSVAAISSRARSEFLTLQVDCVDATSGEPVVTSRETLVLLTPTGGEGS